MKSNRPFSEHYFRVVIFAGRFGGPVASHADILLARHARDCMARQKNVCVSEMPERFASIGEFLTI